MHIAYLKVLLWFSSHCHFIVVRSDWAGGVAGHLEQQLAVAGVVR